MWHLCKEYQEKLLKNYVYQKKGKSWRFSKWVIFYIHKNSMFIPTHFLNFIIIFISQTTDSLLSVFIDCLNINACVYEI